MTDAPETGITRALAEFALEVEPRHAPEAVQHETLRILLDCLGSAVGGLVTPSGRIASELVQGERGRLEAHVVGGGQVSLLPAVFANTVLTNALDFEPVGPEGHVCAVAVPVALAVAEAVDASGAELFAGLLAGLEIGGRVGGAIRRFNQSGAKETPSVRGTAHAAFAAVAAAGRLLKLTPDQMTNAFGIAGYGATLPTLKKVMSSAHAPMTKYDHLGAMARNGVEAALLAQRGFTGDKNVLEGNLGFWRFAGALGCNWDFFTQDLGSFWTVPQTWFKRYPIILYATPALEAVRSIIRDNGIDLDKIEHVEVRTNRSNRVQSGKEILDAMDAWTSYSYNLAAGLYDVWPRRTWQEPCTYQDPKLLALAAKIEICPLPKEDLRSVGNYWEGWCPASATIHAGGQRFEAWVENLPRLADEELRDKYHDNVGGLLSAANAQALEDACWNLAQVDRARQVAGYLTK